MSASFRSEDLQAVVVLGPESFFASLDEKPAFDPHVDAVRDGQIRALGDKCRGDFGVARREDLVEECLVEG